MINSVYDSPEEDWLTTLLYSWGGDTPQEVIWGINGMIQWLNEKHGFQLEELYEPYGSSWDEVREDRKIKAVVEALKTLKRET